MILWLALLCRLAMMKCISTTDCDCWRVINFINKRLIMRDAVARQEAIDIARSFNVRAPAGSGKTGLLTQRALALLAVVERPEEILCVTFTRKAAGEMRARIIAALQRADEPPPAELFAATTHALACQVMQRSKEKKWRLLEFPNQLTIVTIDGFCSGLVRQCPIVSGLGACPPISERTSELFHRAARQLLLRLDGDDSALSKALERILTPLHNDQQRFCNYMERLLVVRDQWSLFSQAHMLSPHSRQEALRQLADFHLARTADALALVFSKQMQSEILIPLMQFSAEKKDEDINIQSLAADADNLLEWRKLRILLLTTDEKWRKQLTVKEGFPPKTPQKKAMKDVLERLREMPPAQTDDLKDLLVAVALLPDPGSDNPATDDLLIILPALAEELDAVFRDKNCIDFTGVAFAANQALGNADAPTDLLLKLDYRIRHILVDEFQDTSSVQVELLAKLTAGWEAGDGRTVFLVGDPMQSCYQFRGANLPLYLHTRKHGIAAEAGDLLPEQLSLSSNFRSAPRLVNWVNQTFGAAFPRDEEPDIGATPFEPAEAAKGDNEESEVRVVGIVRQKDEVAANVSIREARIIVTQVQALLEKYPQGSIGILARSRGHLETILAELVAVGISWRAEAVEALSNRAVVMDLLILTRAISNTLDRIAWLALLRTPWFGLNNTDLWELGCVGEEVRLLEALENATRTAQLSAHGKQVLRRGLPVLRQALEARARLSLAEVVEAAWVELGGVVGLDDADEADARDFLNLLERHCDGGRLPSAELLEQEVKKLYAAPASCGDTRVQIMTMHKAKGLEFDSVILPGLHRHPRSADNELLRWQTHSGTLLLDAQPANDLVPSLFNYLKYLAIRKERWERTRLLYIACTRARKRLYLYGETCRDDAGCWQPPGKRSLLSCVWESLHPTMEFVEENISPADTSAVLLVETALQRLPAQWQLPSPPDSFIDNVTFADDDGEHDYDAIALGVLVHQLLEQVSMCGWPIQLLSTTLEDELMELGINPDNREKLAQKALQCISNVQSDTRGQWLFAGTAVRRDSEMALAVADGKGGYGNIRLDLLVEEDSTCWVVDYKTSIPRNDESTEQFYDRQMRQYRPQVERYVAAMRQLRSDKPVRGALYFPAMIPPGWVELT
ncbi:UvrD-helicase domain-containing protein [Candidatus Persebacteraceae bacterium Df01]|jgi:ATP-dependent exoDNAse (exonuclease V) beta subunit|uniref:DNA 3'-5' helicase n=1 Tax=Candidatus Doriopsillibacter californiensis TaxID=2970740 RepID=A0ABT7QLI3_9GAMM|nr:UvrD-helicase domain-containing protein [Candidatus Persebacteraceae bacterium Df01]